MKTCLLGGDKTRLLCEVEQRHGFAFLLAATQVPLPELHNALAGGFITQKTHAKLSAWVDERIETTMRGNDA